MSDGAGRIRVAGTARRMAEDERDFSCSRGRSEAELFGLLASSVSISILEALRNVNGRTVAQISLQTGRSPIDIRRQVMAMQDLGLLRARVADHGVYCGAVDARVYELLALASAMLAATPRPQFDADRHGDFAATSSSDG